MDLEVLIKLQIIHYKEQESQIPRAILNIWQIIFSLVLFFIIICFICVHGQEQPERIERGIFINSFGRVVLKTSWKQMMISIEKLQKP